LTADFLWIVVTEVTSFAWRWLSGNEYPNDNYPGEIGSNLYTPLSRVYLGTLHGTAKGFIKNGFPQSRKLNLELSNTKCGRMTAKLHNSQTRKDGRCWASAHPTLANSQLSYSNTNLVLSPKWGLLLCHCDLM
jgi:hypothetical protein